MPILTQPAFGPKLSIGFITGGCLIDVWCLVWRLTIAGPELTPMQRFWFYGLLFSGVTFIAIGMLLGHIGRAARKAELPPTDEAVHAEERVQAASPPPVAAVPQHSQVVASAPVLPATPPQFS